jgi:hypothetical protein
MYRQKKDGSSLLKIAGLPRISPVIPIGEIASRGSNVQ